MATKYYGINDKWTDDNIENVIVIASEDGSVDSVKVNGEEYSGGGGGSSYTLLASAEYTVNTSSTTAVDVGTIALGADGYKSAYMLYVKVRNNSGKILGTLYGTDTIIRNPYQAYNQTAGLGVGNFYIVQYVGDDWDNVITYYTGQYGIFPNSVDSNGNMVIKARYNSTNTMTINSTFTVEVYALDYPNNEMPFI